MKHLNEIWIFGIAQDVTSSYATEFANFGKAYDCLINATNRLFDLNAKDYSMSDYMDGDPSPMSSFMTDFPDEDCEWAKPNLGQGSLVDDEIRRSIEYVLDYEVSQSWRKGGKWTRMCRTWHQPFICFLIICFINSVQFSA